jgi:ABC-type polysaccharide transport system, permease component
VTNAMPVKIHSKSYLKRIVENRQMYLFLILPLIWLIIFKYGPMYGAQIAFKNYVPKMGIWGSEFVGLANFKQFFSSLYFERTVKNTLILSMYSLAVGFPTPIIFALLLNSVRSKKWKSWIENVTYMPHFISTVVMVGIMMRVFDYYTGVVHNMLAVFGISWNVHMFTGDPNFRNLYIWSGVWQGTGWGSIIYMAALSGVDPELHEAAIVDGATRIRRIWNIDLPSIIPTITITLILRCGSIMSIGFDKVFLMQNDTNLNASEVISTYVYKVGLTAEKGMQLSYSSAVGMFNSVINLITISLVNYISNRINGSGMW